MAIQLEYECTNNQAEYEALIIRLEILLYWHELVVQIFGDSQLVINQLSIEYKCTSMALISYYVLAKQLMDQFDYVKLHVRRSKNDDTNIMA